MMDHRRCIVLLLLILVFCEVGLSIVVPDIEHKKKQKDNSFASINQTQVEVDVNLILLGFDRMNSDYSSIQKGVLDKLNSHKIQRFLEVNGMTIQEKEGSHVEYLIHYHLIDVHPNVAIYLRHLMKSMSRNVDMNLMNVKIINPYEVIGELKSLFSYVSKNSNKPTPKDSDLILLLMNSQLNLDGPFGFSTEFSYTEMQKMIDEIFKDQSQFAISEFIFPLTEPLASTDEFESNEQESDDTDYPEIHPIPSAPEEERSITSDYCVLDWRLISFQWAYEHDQQLQEHLQMNPRRSSTTRIQRNLHLLQYEYNKKEQKRILVEMKQVLNNDYVMNDELVNMIEGTHVVSDYIFVDRFYLLDISAGPFEWGSIPDESNIRTRSSLLFSGDYPESLRYFNTYQEAFVNHAGYILHIVERACHRKTNIECKNDQQHIQTLFKQIKMSQMMNVYELSLYYSELITLEETYKQPLSSSIESQLSADEIKITIQLSRILSDFIAHFVTPPFVISSSSSSSLLPLPSILHSDLLSFHSSSSYISPHHFTPDLITHLPHTVDAILSTLSSHITLHQVTKEKIHFQVNYFTRTEFEDQFTIDENYFDYSIFRGEIERLKLTNQDFHFSFQEFKLENEPRLQTAILRSMTSIIIPHLNNKQSIFPVQQSYINSTVLFESLRSHDHAVSSKDIQIYIFCMTGTTKKPLLLDKTEQVVYHSDGLNHMVFAIQNEMISTNSPYFVNNFPLYYNLHDIMSPLLSCVFELLSNTKLNLYFGEQIHTNKSPLTEDCIYRSIGSVDRVFSANHVYSMFHIEIIKKSQFIVRLQIVIDEYNEMMKTLRTNDRLIDDVVSEVLSVLQSQFISIISTNKESINIEQGERDVRDARVILQRIHWVWQMIRYQQIESCKSHVADIDYGRVLTRSIVFSIIIALFAIIVMQKSMKKVKEM